jgi:hypothetical protein
VGQLHDEVQARSLRRRGNAIVAKGYETGWIPSTNATLEHARSDVRVRIDVATVVLRPE